MPYSRAKHCDPSQPNHQLCSGCSVCAAPQRPPPSPYPPGPLRHAPSPALKLTHPHHPRPRPPPSHQEGEGEPSQKLSPPGEGERGEKGRQIGGAGTTASSPDTSDTWEDSSLKESGKLSDSLPSTVMPHAVTAAFPEQSARSEPHRVDAMSSLIRQVEAIPGGPGVLVVLALLLAVGGLALRRLCAGNDYRNVRACSDEDVFEEDEDE
ncbi:MAG: hypothetical protein SGPRY_013698, partial [Prymnesium sp.]